MGNLLELAFVIFIIYIVYKLVFELIVPVSKATTQFKSKMQDVHKMQQDYMQQQQNTSAKSSPKPSSHDEDYIDFEEIK